VTFFSWGVQKALGKAVQYHHTLLPGRTPRKKTPGVWQAIVLGAFQGGSKDIHALQEVLFDSRPIMKGLAMGREGLEWGRSSIISGLRRELNLAGAKLYSACLLDRKEVGEAHRQKAERRAWIKREEERKEVETRSHWIADVQRRGFFRGRYTSERRFTKPLKLSCDIERKSIQHSPTYVSLLC
jgi:hypothetical protein